MDIPDRLKLFIDHLGLTNSQFADKTGIPRPTLSQILNRRNQTINNQLLQKLNESYPDLNILWLLFEQGEMQTVSNIKTSSPENELDSGIFASEVADSEEYAPYSSSFFNDHAIETDNSDAVFSRTEVSKKEISNSPASVAVPTESTTTVENHSGAKKIRNIIVFYEDGTFETFRSGD